LPDDILVQVGNQGLGRWDRGEKSFLGRALREWSGFRGRLGQGDNLREGSGCAEAADADGWIDAALEKGNVEVEAERAARRFVGHTDTGDGGISGPPTTGGRLPPSMVSVCGGRDGLE